MPLLSAAALSALIDSSAADPIGAIDAGVATAWDLTALHAARRNATSPADHALVLQTQMADVVLQQQTLSDVKGTMTLAGTPEQLRRLQALDAMLRARLRQVHDAVLADADALRGTAPQLVREDVAQGRVAYLRAVAAESPDTERAAARTEAEFTLATARLEAAKRHEQHARKDLAHAYRGIDVSAITQGPASLGAIAIVHAQARADATVESHTVSALSKDLQRLRKQTTHALQLPMEIPDAHDGVTPVTAAVPSAPAPRSALFASRGP